MLSHAFWRAAFGGDPAVVGRHITVQGLDCTVAGVMPEGFSGHSATDVDLFAPLSVAMHGSPGWDRDQYRNLLAVVVRVPQDETVAAAETQAQHALGYRIGLSPIVGADVGATEQRVAWWLTGVSLLILVIGLANASTLLVVRAAKRIQDVVIRTALGASRGRLVAQGDTRGSHRRHGRHRALAGIRDVARRADPARPLSQPHRPQRAGAINGHGRGHRGRPRARRRDHREHLASARAGAGRERCRRRAAAAAARRR